MVDIVVLIATTPVPTILAIGGLLLLLLGISDGPVVGISIPEERDRLATIIGGLFLFVGLAFYALPIFLGDAAVDPAEVAVSIVVEENALADSPADQAEEVESLSFLEQAHDWPLIYQDNFETDRGIWQVGEIPGTNNNVNLAIQDGQYIWSMDILNETIEDTFGAYVSVADVDLANTIYLAVDIEWISGIGADNRYGITYRRQGRDLYSFRIENNDQFRVGMWLNGEWQDMVSLVSIPNYEPGDHIRLAVITNQSAQSFFINDNF